MLLESSETASTTTSMDSTSESTESSESTTQSEPDSTMSTESTATKLTASTVTELTTETPPESTTPTGYKGVHYKLTVNLSTFKILSIKKYDWRLLVSHQDLRQDSEAACKPPAYF